MASLETTAPSILRRFFTKRGAAVRLTSEILSAQTSTHALNRKCIKQQLSSACRMHPLTTYIGLDHKDQDGLGLTFPGSVSVFVVLCCKGLVFCSQRWYCRCSMGQLLLKAPITVTVLVSTNAAARREYTDQPCLILFPVT